MDNHNNQFFDNFLYRRDMDELLNNIEKLDRKTTSLIHSQRFKEKIKKDSLIRMIRSYLNILNEGESILFYD